MALYYTEPEILNASLKENPNPASPLVVSPPISSPVPETVQAYPIFHSLAVLRPGKIYPGKCSWLPEAP